MAEHLICNQEVVGSTPTAGSKLAQLGSRRRPREDRQEKNTAGSVGCAGTARQGSPGLVVPGCSMETRHLTDDTGAECARGPGGRGPRVFGIGVGAERRRAARARSTWLAVRASAFGPGIEHRGRFQSGQMGQTVNLVVTPSAVRIRLSPPKPLAHEPSRSARVRAKLAIPSSSPSARLECESTRESNPAQRFAACAQLRAGVVQW